MNKYIISAITLGTALLIGAAIGIWGARAGLLSAAAIIAIIVFCLVLRKPILGILLIALALPFERIGSLHFGGVNIRLSQLILGATLLAWCIFMLSKRQKIVAAKSIIFLILFLASNLVSVFFAIDAKRAIMVFVFTVIVMLLFFVMPNIIRTRSEARQVVIFWILGSIVAILFGLFQFAGDMMGLPNNITMLVARYGKQVLGFTRAQSTFLEPLYFANYLIPIITVLALALIRKVRLLPTYITAILLALSVLVFILSFSKGGFLALGVIGLLILLWQVRYFFRKENLGFIIGALIFISLLGTSLLVITGQTANIDKIIQKTTTVLTGGTVLERAEASGRAIEAYRTSPLFGIGPGNYGAFFTGYNYSADVEIWPIANNEYLELLAETGICGLVLFILFFITLIFEATIAIRRTRDHFIRFLLIALVLSSLGTAVQCATFSTLYIMNIWFMLGLLASLCLYVKRGENQVNKQFNRL